MFLANLRIFLKKSRPNVPVAHPRMTVSDFINGNAKEWDEEMLENFVA